MGVRSVRRIVRPILAVAALALVASACTGLKLPIVATDDGGTAIGAPVDVRFGGTENVSDLRILRAIEDRLYDLSRRPDSESIVEDVRFDVEDLYRSEGFPDVSVRTRIEPSDREGARTLIVDVTEGPLVTVREMTVVGGTEYTRDRLREFWLQRSSGALGLGDPLYVRNDVLGFVQSLKIFLRGEGYLEADVTLASEDRSASGDEVDVVVRIDEGPRYEVGTVRIAPALRDALGDASLESPAGEHASARRIDAFRTALIDRLRRLGRPEPRLRAKLERRTDAGRHFVDVDIDGEPGPLARIVDVRVDGLDKTVESVVQDRIEFEVGAIFDGQLVDESLRELYLTGLFQRVDVEHVWLDDEEAGVDGARPLQVHITVVERDSRSVEVLAGYGSYERIRGKLRFEESNLFGTGRGLLAEAKLSQRGWRLQSVVTDPDLLDTGLRLSVSADASRREEPSFVDQAYGGTVALARQIDDHWTVRGGYSYRLHEGLTTDVVDPAAAITRYIAGGPFVETRYDRRDSLIYPRDGWQANVQLDANDPVFGADIEFVRVRFGASYYVSLSDRLGVALRSDQGLLWPGTGSDQIPLQERFYNGGENTVRSFREAQLGPLDVNGKPVGGEYRNVFSAELRARLIRTLEGALFTDAGNVGSSVTGFGFSDMRYAVGAGLRLALPIGPVRVDAAWNPDRRPGEREWTVHLRVGFPFCSREGPGARRPRRATSAASHARGRHMTDPHIAPNRRSWNAATRAHQTHKRDQAAFLRGGGSTLFPEEIELLGEVSGARVAHLMCNCGEDTLGIAARGARATGVDLSDVAIAEARRLAEASGIAAEFACAEVGAWLAEAARDGRSFDVGFLSYGALPWVADLPGLARGIAAVLAPQGRLVVVEFHPLAWSVDGHGHLADDYFVRGPIELPHGVPDYVAATGPAIAPMGFAPGVEAFENPEAAVAFQWTVADLVQAVADAGLRVEVLREYPWANGCRLHPGMREIEGRRFVRADGVVGLPLMIGLVARAGG